MNALVVASDFASDEPFFAPVDHDRIDELLSQYSVDADKISQVSTLMNSDARKDVMPYFLDGNCRDSRNHSLSNAKALFEPVGALRSLDARYWDRAFTAIKIWDDMPEKRRSDWREKIQNNDTAPFEDETVRTVIAGLDAARSKFLAERVDGIFMALSRAHVTNRPEGFFKRMILGYCYDGLSYGMPSPNHKYAGYVNDLRCVIAMFMGRDAPQWYRSSDLLRVAYRRHGEWLNVDGGALRVRAYLKGTVHIEINPDIAYRLNMVLASMHPAAIPSEFRTKPKARPKEFVMMGRPLPFSVLEILAAFSAYRDNRLMWHCTGNSTQQDNRLACDEARSVMVSIGGALDEKGSSCEFDYDPTEVIEDIIASGCIPDKKAHQFYPTPYELGKIASGFAWDGSTENSEWLEPSAGMGDLAQFCPPENTTCVEISPLHAKVLEAKGFEVNNVDFMAYTTSAPFDRILMNPPFSEGRWKAHVEHAAGMLKKRGRLVAILPASAKNKDFLRGFDMNWSQVYDNMFAGTSASVVILIADKHA